MERIKLKVLGITYSQVQAGAYALVLAQDDGPYRIPVVVGISEAQAIAIKLENIVPPRPLPHDLITSLAHAFSLSLDEVFLYKFEKGVFLSELKFSGEDRQISIDSRTSDAIALALRTGAPIFTTREILETTGFLSTEDSPKSEAKGAENHARLDKFSLTELEKMLQKCVEREEYERAAEIKRIIEQKKSNKNETEKDN